MAVVGGRGMPPISRPVVWMLRRRKPSLAKIGVHVVVCLHGQPPSLPTG
jgi:hypothetical protein